MAEHLLSGSVVRTAMPCPICAVVVEFNAVMDADGVSASVPPDAEINVHLHTAHPGQKVPRDKRMPEDQQIAASGSLGSGENP